LDWFVDAAVLAHEFLGDQLELRTLPPEMLDQRIRQIRIRRCREFALLVGGNKISALGRERVYPFSHARMPTLLVSGAAPINLDLLIEAAPALTKLVGARRNTLETMLMRLMRQGFVSAADGPTDEQYSRAIQRHVEIVRDHFAATRGGVERRVRALLPIPSYLKGREIADRLSEQHHQLGPLLKLREWLAEELGDEVANRLWAVMEETEDQAQLRRRLDYKFRRYNAILIELGYPSLNDEEDFRRLFEVYLNELRPNLVDRVRRRYRYAYERGDNLAEYLAQKRLDFLAFDPSWPLTMEELDRAFVQSYVSNAAEAALGPDDDPIQLPDLRAVNLSNQKMVMTNHPRMASIVRAWCRKKDRGRPVLMDPADPQPLIKALEQAGLFDFERLTAESLPSACMRIGAWPIEMEKTLVLEALELVEADLDIEEREAREARQQAEITQRTITFSGKALDTGAPDFEQVFAELAGGILAAGSDWYARSRPPRLSIQEHQGADGRNRGGRANARSPSWRDQPPEAIRRAMGIASEYLAREYLKRRYPTDLTDAEWESASTSCCRDRQCGGASPASICGRF
jgi:hypothetical protein